MLNSPAGRVLPCLWSLLLPAPWRWLPCWLRIFTMLSWLLLLCQVQGGVEMVAGVKDAVVGAKDAAVSAATTATAKAGEE